MPNIKICHLVRNFEKDYGGAQKIIESLCKHLPVDQYEQKVVYASGNGTLRDSIPEAVEVFQENIVGPFGLPNYLSMAKLVRKERPDIIHIHSPVMGLVGRPVSKFLGVSTVSSVHTTNYKLPAILGDFLSLHLSDAVVGVSSLATQGASRRRIPITGSRPEYFTIHNGIDLKKFQNSVFRDDCCLGPETGLSSGDFAIGYVGRLTRAKGVDILIQALPKLLPFVPNLKLILVGRGELENELENLAIRLGVREQVKFLGGRDDVERIFPCFNISVFPSRWEGFGLAPIEAMAAGSPVIASDLPVFREVIGDGGLLVRNDPESYTTEIVRLYEDVEARGGLQRLGGRRSMLFSVDRMVERYMDVYHHIAEK